MQNGRFEHTEQAWRLADGSIARTEPSSRIAASATAARARPHRGASRGEHHATPARGHRPAEHGPLRPRCSGTAPACRRTATCCSGASHGRASWSRPAAVAGRDRLRARLPEPGPLHHACSASIVGTTPGAYRAVTCDAAVDRTRQRKSDRLDHRAGGNTESSAATSRCRMSRLHSRRCMKYPCRGVATNPCQRPIGEMKTNVT